MEKQQVLLQRRELPPSIAAGLEDQSKRDLWNDVAQSEYGLPTESWREHIARRQHYDSVFARLADGEIASINDLITLNLDIKKFLYDVIAKCDEPKLVLAFWRAIQNVSILDPTCGSGAFLFAALNVLEPIYVSCIEAMEGFLDATERNRSGHNRDSISDIQVVLDQIAAHTNQRYFILKSIVVSNLYGVDIMKEAVEICKLRLFLKLVAQLESFDRIEPLPDIDFNIRPGNTVVGFASLEHLKRAFSTDMVRQQVLPKLLQRASSADHAFRRFQNTQLEQTIDGDSFIDAKMRVKDSLYDLQNDLDRYLAMEYGIALERPDSCEVWRETHLPFHWFVEFHEIMCDGGFDVIIGNPPYIATKKVRRSYNVKDFECSECTDVYAWILERTQNLLKIGGRTGMIVPLSIGFSGDFDQCRKLLIEGYSINWFSSFGRIPAALFSFDVRVRNTIHLGFKGEGTKTNFTSRLHRWFDISRRYLFDQIRYTEFKPKLWEGRIAKLNSSKLSNIFAKLLSSSTVRLGMQTSTRPTEYVLHFKKTAYNWLNFCRHLPPCYDEHGNSIPQTKFGQIYFSSKEALELAMLLGNGKLMLVYWFIVADDFDVTRWNFAEFPIDFSQLHPRHRENLLQLPAKLEEAMLANVQFKLNAKKQVGNYNLAKCRHITDQSDKIFLKALGISDAWESIELYCTQNVRTDFTSTHEDD